MKMRCDGVKGRPGEGTASVITLIRNVNEETPKNTGKEWENERTAEYKKTRPLLPFSHPH